jgi:YqaJ-like viral recombinase domain
MTKKIRIEARSHTDQWYAARRGMLTASRMHDACNFLQGGKPSAKRTNYMKDVVAERLTGIATSHYVSMEMQWGIDHEKDAIAAFERETGLLVWPAGLVLHPTIEFFGATPDGFVYVWIEDREVVVPLEAKCPTTQTFIEWRMANEIPDRHRLQLLAQMSCCEALLGIFVAHDPRIRVGRNLIWHTLDLPDRSEIEETEAKARNFLEQAEALFQKVTESGDAPVSDLSTDYRRGSVHESVDAEHGERPGGAPDQHCDADGAGSR